jgi:hypothetical protein
VALDHPFDTLLHITRVRDIQSHVLNATARIHRT